MKSNAMFLYFSYNVLVCEMRANGINSSRNISWEVVVCSEKSTELGLGS